MENKEYVAFHPESQLIAVAKYLGLGTVKLSNSDIATIWLVDNIVFDANWEIMGEL